MSKKTGKEKFGAGHAAAMARQGLREIRGAMYTQSNVAQAPDYGIYGNKTPGEIADERDPNNANHELSADQEPRSTLKDRLNQAERQREASSRDNREISKE